MCRAIQRRRSLRVRDGSSADNSSGRARESRDNFNVIFPGMRYKFGNFAFLKNLAVATSALAES
jgi:hypothetical protein